MKRFVLLSLFVFLIIPGCYQQQKSLYRQEQDGIIYNQNRHTPFRKIKLKITGGNEYYGVCKDTSGNYRMQIVKLKQKRIYDFTFLNTKLVLVWVCENVADNRIKWKNGYYYFRDDNLIHREEPEPNFVDIEEIKALAEEYLRKATTL